MTPDEAKEAYRAAWSSYCLSPDAREKEQFAKLMDDLQPRICRGPGPEWKAFIKTLPGFEDFWNRWKLEALEKMT